MRIRRFHLALGGILFVIGVTTASFFTRDHWLGWIVSRTADVKAEEAQPARAEEPKILKLGPRARANLGLSAKPVVLQSYWRTIQVPGIVVDRPGHSDRGISAPAVSVVAKVHAFPGDTVKPGDRLFTLRLISEYIHNSQSELFKTTREMELVKEQHDRLEGPTKSGAIPEARLIELHNQLRRLTAAVQACRQDLLTRGLSTSQIESVAAGKFIAEIEVVAPLPSVDDRQLVGLKPAQSATTVTAPSTEPAYEVQELKCELGQQVQAGQLLCLLSNHQSLYIEGHGFRREASYLEQAARNSWPVRVEFAEDETKHWPPLEQTFSIRHLANTVDPATRTFNFYLPLANQSRSHEKEGRTFLVWRFRPGQRVRLQVPVEALKDALVLPAGAVAREGPEAYVFRQNGDLFDRRPVHVLYEDRVHVVLANDGSVTPGMYLAQSAAASLNRVLKAQNASGGLPPGAHFHADGSLHIPGQ